MPSLSIEEVPSGRWSQTDAHELGIVLAAAERLRHRLDIVFLIIGEGNQKVIPFLSHQCNNGEVDLTGWLLPPTTGVRQGFRGVYSALAERHSDEAECASCKEGWDGGDADDWPVLACALAIGCPVWTEDADIFGAGIATWTTDHVEIYLVSLARCFRTFATANPSQSLAGRAARCIGPPFRKRAACRTNSLLHPFFKGRSAAPGVRLRLASRQRPALRVCGNFY